METIIGLGSAGCNIADKFSKHSQYKIIKFDVDLYGENCYFLPRFETPEEYEGHLSDYTSVFDKIDTDILFILGGSGNVSGGALRLLEQIGPHQPSVLYIQPNIALLGEKKRQQERLVYYVLQEYARSGLIKRLYLVSNTCLEEILGGVAVVGYYDRLNELIVSTIHMINVFDHSDFVVGSFSEPHEIARISTFGISSLKNEQKMFFLLDNVREMVYYYGINEERLKTDTELFKMITDNIENQDIKTSYGIYSTKYDEDYVYCVAHSSLIQLRETEKKALQL